jgi:hypothetical protein
MSNVSQIIFSQLGGHRFAIMTGAKDFVHGETTLSFKIPLSKGINQVRISLDVSDSYLVEFFRYKNFDLTMVGQKSLIHAEQLGAIFTQATGLDVSL